MRTRTWNRKPPPPPGAPPEAPKPPAPPPLAPHAGPKENEEWFRNLPPKAQEEMRARWLAAAKRDGARVQLVRETLARSIQQGVVVFAVNEFVFAPLWLPHLLAALVVGAATGAIWFHIGAGRFRCGTTVIAPYALLRVFGYAANTDAQLVTYLIWCVLGFASIVTLSMIAGFVRERRVADAADV